MAYSLIHLLHCQKTNKHSLGLCVLHSELYFLLQLLMCPSVSSSNYTENKFYTFFSHSSRGIPRDISWPKFRVKRRLLSLLKYLERSLSGLSPPNPSFSVGNTHQTLFRQLILSLQSIWDSQMLKCNLSGILWPLFLRSFTPGKEAQVSPPEPVPQS